MDFIISDMMFEAEVLWGNGGGASEKGSPVERDYGAGKYLRYVLERMDQGECISSGGGHASGSLDCTGWGEGNDTE